MAKRSKPAPVEELDELDELEDLEEDDLDELEEEEEAPPVKKRGAKKTAPAKKAAKPAAA